MGVGMWKAGRHYVKRGVRCKDDRIISLRIEENDRQTKTKRKK